MTDLVGQSDRNRATRSLCAQVAYRAGKYASTVEEAIKDGALVDREVDLMKAFEVYAAEVLQQWSATSWPKVHDLIFAGSYAPNSESVPIERRRLLIVALLAAEVEFHSPLKLSQEQSKDLAVILERLGGDCVREKMYLHAIEAFDRAADLRLFVADSLARDRCLYRRNQARQRAERSKWLKAVQWISWAICGYGYKPYRLLVWVVAQLVLFGTAVIVVTGGATPIASLHLVLTNFLNPAGADTDGPGVAKVLLLIESYMGVLSINVFFALLVRRWFR